MQAYQSLKKKLIWARGQFGNSPIYSEIRQMWADFEKNCSWERDTDFGSYEQVQKFNYDGNVVVELQQIHESGSCWIGMSVVFDDGTRFEYDGCVDIWL